MEAMNLEIGAMVGGCCIERLLAEGSYAAVHSLSGKRVAVKVIEGAHESRRDRLWQLAAEASVMNRLRHPHIASVCAFGRLADGRPYVVTELLGGRSLRQHLNERGRPAPAEALTILDGIARALDAAHGVGIAHCNMK